VKGMINGMKKTTLGEGNRGIDPNDYYLPNKGMAETERIEKLHKYEKYIKNKVSHFMGYQANQNMNYSSEVSKFLDCHVNNIGDPFTDFEEGFVVNSKPLEKAVLDYYAKLWHAKVPHNQEDEESYWGYVLSMGSSEGNIYGLWGARDYLEGKKLVVNDDDDEDDDDKVIKTKYLKPILNEQLPNAYKPVIFFSEDAHYSITKFTRVLKIPTFDEIGKEKGYINPLTGTDKWKRSTVPSKGGLKGDGSIDIDKLATLVEVFASKGHPILICLNYGTTFKGAYDDVEEVGNRLMPIFEKHNLIDRDVEYKDKNKDTGEEELKTDKRNGFWIHVDGALGASYAPFLKMAHNQNKSENTLPKFDFELPWVNSIVTSGHKWPGAPWPCGIYMSKVKYQVYPPSDPEYISSPDTTFSGSRNGFSAIILWDYFAKNSYEKQIEKVKRCEENAKYLKDQLDKLNEELIAEKKLDIWVERTPLALTIRFRRPNVHIVKRYSLSCETIKIDGEERKYAHIFVMDSVDRELIDEFVQELRPDGAFDDKETEEMKLSTNINGLGWK